MEVANDLTISQIQQRPLHPDQIVSAAHPEMNKLPALNMLVIITLTL